MGFKGVSIIGNEAVKGVVQLLRKTVTMTFGTIAANATEDSAAIPIPGVAFGDVVQVAQMGAQPTGGVLSGFVFSAGNVKIRWLNTTGSTINPGTVSEVYEILVTAHRKA